MPKIVFNNVPKTPQHFPFEEFDNEIDLKDLKLSFRVCDTDYARYVSLGVVGSKSSHIHIAEIELFHSGGVSNFEQTMESAEILVKEIVERFNSFAPKGQECF